MQLFSESGEVNEFPNLKFCKSRKTIIQFSVRSVLENSISIAATRPAYLQAAIERRRLRTESFLIKYARLAKICTPAREKS